MAIDPPSQITAATSLSANSLEGALADHLAFCATSLAQGGQLAEAIFALAEARRVQAQVLRKVAEATGARLGSLLDERLVVGTNQSMLAKNAKLP